MRNFNQPAAVALTSMATFLGGNALAPIDYASAEQAPTSSPQLFQDCAHDVTANPTDPNFYVVGSYMYIDPQSVSAHKATAGFELSDSQYALMNAGAADNYQPCDGSLSVQDTLQLKVGSFTTTVPNASVRLVVNNASMQEYSPPEASASGSFSYLQACKIAKQLRGRKATVTAKVIENRTYTDTGYASVKTTSTPYSTSLPCDKLSPTVYLVPDGPPQRPH